MLRINKGELKLGAVKVLLDIFGKSCLNHIYLNLGLVVQKYFLRGYLLTDYYIFNTHWVLYKMQKKYYYPCP